MSFESTDSQFSVCAAQPYGIIYKAILQQDGRIYIGQTTQRLEQRKSSHKYKSKNIHKTHIHAAISKYGLDAFSWEIIDTAANQSDLDAKEKHWIAHYRANEKAFGFNLTAGGRDGNLQNFRLGALGNRQNNGGIPVMCLETGVIYSSKKAAAQATNQTVTNIHSCLVGRIAKARGLTFDFVNEVDRAQIDMETVLAKRTAIHASSKRVQCLDSNVIFQSLGVAALAMGVKKSTLSTAIHKGYRCCGKRFVYAGVI